MPPITRRELAGAAASLSIAPSAASASAPAAGKRPEDLLSAGWTLEKLVKETVGKIKKGTKIDELMKELSEDPGSASSGQSYDVTPQAGLVEPFKNLSLRLNLNEVGVVKTDFGIHIIQRVE